MLKKTNRATGELVQLFCRGVQKDDFKDIHAILDGEWLPPTEQEREKIKEWSKVPKQAPTEREPACMRDIRQCNLDLIKHLLYCHEWNCQKVDEYEKTVRDVKPMRYDKNLINSGTSDSTAIRVEKILENANPLVRERKRICMAIQQVYNEYALNNVEMYEFMLAAYSLDEEGKKRYTEAELMEKFDICRTTIYKKKREIWECVAAQIGWEIPPERK